MNTFSPDQMYDVIQARHQDIRNQEAAYEAAKSAQANNPNRLQTVADRIATFAQQFRSQSTQATSTDAVPQLRNKQA